MLDPSAPARRRRVWRNRCRRTRPHLRSRAAGAGLRIERTSRVSPPPWSMQHSRWRGLRHSDDSGSPSEPHARLDDAAGPLPELPARPPRPALPGPASAATDGTCERPGTPARWCALRTFSMRFGMRLRSGTATRPGGGSEAPLSKEPFPRDAGASLIKRSRETGTRWSRCEGTSGSRRRHHGVPLARRVVVRAVDEVDIVGRGGRHTSPLGGDTSSTALPAGGYIAGGCCGAAIGTSCTRKLTVRMSSSRAAHTR